MSVAALNSGYCWFQVAKYGASQDAEVKEADCRGRLCLDLWRGRKRWLTAEGGFVWNCGVDGKGG